MPVTAPPVEAAAPVDDPSLLPRRDRLRLGVRWAVLIGATLLAYWRTLVAVADEIATFNLLSYLLILPVLLALAAWGTVSRRKPGLPIHDRQTDHIIGYSLLLIAVFLQALLNPRYAAAYLTLHLDLLSLWLFVLAASILLFGLRPVGQFYPLWLLALAVFPLPPRLLEQLLGGTPVACGVVILLLGMAAAGIAGGRTLRRGLVGAGIAGVAGGLVLAIIALAAPDLSTGVYATVPAAAAALVGTVSMYVDRRRRIGLSVTRPLERPVRALTVAQAGPALLVVIAVAVGVHFIPVPEVDREPWYAVSGLDVDGPVPVPAGWREVEVTHYDFVRRIYGRDSDLTRQRLVATEGNHEWDALGRPRAVVVDTIVTDRPLLLSVYPVQVVYDLVGKRFSPTEPVDLAGGVRGWMQTIVDDEDLLTYTRLGWWWRDGEVTQYVTLIAVDNHLDLDVFPEPELTTVGNVNSLLTILFRGTSVVEDDEPDFKDAELLATVADEIITDALARAEEPR